MSRPSTSQCSNSDSEAVPEIPGFYYDHAKKRYFKIQAGAFNPPSDYSSEKIQQRKTLKQIHKQNRDIKARRVVRIRPNLTKLLAAQQLGGKSLSNYIYSQLTRVAGAPLRETTLDSQPTHSLQATLLTSNNVLCCLDSSHCVKGLPVDLLSSSEPTLTASPFYQTFSSVMDLPSKIWQVSTPDLVEISPNIIATAALSPKGRRIHVLHWYGDKDLLAEVTTCCPEPADFYRLSTCPDRYDQILTINASSVSHYSLQSHAVIRIADIDLKTKVKDPCVASQDANVSYICTNRPKNIVALDLRAKTVRFVHDKSSFRMKSRKNHVSDSFVSSMTSLNDGYSLACSFLSGKLKLFDVRKGSYYLTQSCDEALDGPIGSGPQLRYDPISSLLVTSSNRCSRVGVYSSKNLEKLANIETKEPTRAEITNSFGFPVALLVSENGMRAQFPMRKDYFQ